MADNIFTAIADGDPEAVRTMLGQDPGLARKDDGKKNRPLHYAAAHGHLEIAGLLLEHGADVNGQNKKWEWRPIVYAAWNNQLEMCRMLIAAGADVTQTGGQPIHYAGQKKHTEVCRLLAESGAIDELIDPPDPQAIAFFRAAYSYDPETVAGLLKKNPALIETRDTAGRTALHEAGTNGAIEVIRVLTGAGIDVDAKDERGQTAIQRASSHRQLEPCEMLREAGADVDILTACDLGWTDDVTRILAADPAQARTERDGFPLIESVCEAGWQEIGTALVEAGADADIFTACSLGMEERVQEFLEEDPSIVTSRRRLFEYEPLHCAAECGHLEVSRLLLDAGADTNGHNSWKSTPLHLAVIGAREQLLSRAHLEIAELLVKRGADGNALDDYERSPLDLARGNIEYGREHGEDLSLYEEIAEFIEAESGSG